MRINNIDFCITLFFDDENGEPIKEVSFLDFQEVNRFFREHKNDPVYTGCQLSYTFQEMIDGKAAVYSWTKPLEFKELTENEIQAEIDDYLSYEEEANSFCDELDEYSRQFHYSEPSEDYRTKQSRRNEYTYACPRCMRKVDDCRCKNYPGYLVQIDTLILPIIRELNSNGYVTTCCCAGHPGSAEPMQVYIAFDKDYDFDMPFPPGGEYSKLKHSISYSYPDDSSKNEQTAFQQQILNELMDWAEMLLPLGTDE